MKDWKKELGVEITREVWKVYIKSVFQYFSHVLEIIS